MHKRTQNKHEIMRIRKYIKSMHKKFNKIRLYTDYMPSFLAVYLYAQSAQILIKARKCAQECANNMLCIFSPRILVHILVNAIACMCAWYWESAVYFWQMNSYGYQFCKESWNWQNMHPFKCKEQNHAVFMCKYM